MKVEVPLETFPTAPGEIPLLWGGRNLAEPSLFVQPFFVSLFTIQGRFCSVMDKSCGRLAR